MLEVDLEAGPAGAGVVEADFADLAVHPDAPLDEPAEGVDGGDDEGVERVQGHVEVQGEVGEGLEDGEEGHEEGVDDDFTGGVGVSFWQNGEG